MTPGLHSTNWTCPSCGRDSGASRNAFCPRCGEQRLVEAPPDFLSPWQRWKHSLWALVRHPGMLTADWRDGRRRGQIAPLSLFLAINVVFFVTQSLSGLSVVSIPLRAHLHDQPYAAVAERLLAHRLASLQVDRARFEDRFDLQQQTLAKASIIALVVPMALTCTLLLRRRQQPFSTHWAFALHFHAYAMAFLIPLFVLLGLVMRLYMAKHWTIEAGNFDLLVSSIQVLVFGSYLVRSAGCTYSLGHRASLLVSALLITTLVAALYAHRFAVFVLTLFSA